MGEARKGFMDYSTEEGISEFETIESVKTYAQEVRDNLVKREKEGEVPLAGEKAGDLYSKEFTWEEDRTVFKEDILKVILDSGSKELAKAFIDDEIEEYETILSEYHKLIKERIEIGKKNPKEREVYLDLYGYYSVAKKRVEELKKASKDDTDKTKEIKGDLDKARENRDRLADEIYKEISYGRKIKEIYDLIDEIEKKTGKRTLKSVEDKIERLKGIKKKIDATIRVE